MGVRKPSLLKNYLRDFERYVGAYYSFQILRTKKGSDRRSNQDSESLLIKTPFSQP
jgi:hypothetical protein